MIITSSRALATKCWAKAFNQYHRNIEGKTGTALVDGGAFHEAVAHGLSRRGWKEALEIARVDFDKGMANTNIDPNDIETLEAHWGVVEASLDKFREETESDPYEVIQPECTVNVEIPNSFHNCIWLHWKDGIHGQDRWGVPPANAIESNLVLSPHPTPDPNCRCWTPHRIVGKTDAIVLWERNLWINENKTSSIQGDTFWSQWELDIQPSIYLWAVSKALGLPVRGMIFHALFRPSEKQVKNWNRKRLDSMSDADIINKQIEYITYERRCLIRTKEQLDYAIHSLRLLCDEWEWKILHNNFRAVLARGVCNEYNRMCEFSIPCLDPENPDRFEDYSPRHRRYDDDILDSLVQVQVGGGK